jgi:hypothetical protein
MTTAGWYGDAIAGLVIFVTAERGTYRFEQILEKGCIAVRPFLLNGTVPCRDFVD